jgi:hypothetical protein
MVADRSFNPYETRIWQPALFPKKEHCKWYGQPVRVQWKHPSFSLIGYVRSTRKPMEMVPVWECRWFGYVLELDMQVPAEELIRQPKLNPPKANP